MRNKELDALKDNNLASKITGDWLALFWKPTMLLAEEALLIKTQAQE